jgi:hypothetical protein
VTVLYRAIWNDDRDHLVEEAFAAFSAWVGTKSGGTLEVPSDGRAQGVSVGYEVQPDGVRSPLDAPASVRVQRSARRSMDDVLKASFVEQRHDGSRWTTTIRSWMTEQVRADDVDGSGWLWVDVEAVTNQSFDRLAIAAPRLVRDLVRDGVRPRRRCVSLQPEPEFFEGEAGAERLGEILTHIDRDMPIVVFSPFPAAALVPPVAWEDIVRTAAHRNLGEASCVRVDAAASWVLSKVIGPAHGVWNGAFRVYLPGLDPATPGDEWRHRYLMPSRFNRGRDTAAALISAAVAPIAVARRAPDSWEDAATILDGSRDVDIAELNELLQAFDEDSAHQREQLAAQDERYGSLLEDHEAVQQERADLVRTNLVLLRDLNKARSLLREKGLESDYWATESLEQLPPLADSPTLAVLLARARTPERLPRPTPGSLPRFGLAGSECVVAKLGSKHMGSAPGLARICTDGP